MRVAARVQSAGLFSIIFLLTASVVAAAPFAYITNFGSRTISVIDTATNKVVTDIPSRGGGHGVAVNSSGTRVYVANKTANLVSVIDPSRRAVVAELPAGEGPVGVALNPSGTRLFLTNINSLSVFDTATNKLLRASVYVGADPFGLVVNPAGTRVYVAASGSHYVSVVDAESGAIRATISTGAQSAPLGVALNRDGTRLYVANRDTGSVSVVDTGTNTVMKTIAAGRAMNAVVVSPDGARVWASDGAGGVAVIDATTNALLTTIPVGGQPTGIGVNDTGTRVYVANAPTDAVTVIDAASNAIVTTIAVGSAPVALGQFVAPTPLTAVEYLHAGFGHYFVSPLPADISALDSGALLGWARTGETFGVLSAGTPGLADVCRFFSDSFAPKSSHFYTTDAPECASLRQGTTWLYEGLVFGVPALPDALGACPAGLIPLYRLYNEGVSGAPNHRYTTSTAIRSAMLAQGWKAEGAGIGVIACVMPP